MTLALSTLLAGGCTSFREKMGSAADTVAAGAMSPLMMVGGMISGRPAFACIAVAPPAYLSEEEALGVIREELMAADVELSEETASIDGLTMPVYRCTKKRDEELGIDLLEKERTGVRPLEVDALDPVRHIAVEFIGVDDEKAVPGVSRKARIEVYSTRLYAELITEEVNRNGAGDLHYRAFYDPQRRVALAQVPGTPETGKTRAERKESKKSFERAAAQATRQESLRQLRAQVKDFIEWLKGQGAI